MLIYDDFTSSRVPFFNEKADSELGKNLDKSKKLVTFVTGGDPNYELSLDIITEIATSGADIIEIGMPFSDPMADGPTIQLSSNRAIAEGTTIEEIFFICNQVRKINTTKEFVF